MKIVLDDGTSVDLGDVETGLTVGITDYSRRVTDDFGVTTVVRRGFSQQMVVKLGVPFEDVDVVERQLAAVRAIPVQWVADDRFASLNLRGYYADFSIDLAAPPLSYCSLTVNALVATDAVADGGSDPAVDGQASTLKLVQPIAVTDAVLTASNVPENDYGEWAAGTSYAKGARAIKAAAHLVYESAIAGNVGHDPAADTGQWFEVGATNRWAMFDQALGSATTNVGSIQVRLTPGYAITALALLDVVGSTVRVQTNGYDRTIAVSPGAMLFLDLPGSPSAITVTITGGGQVQVGTLLLGKLVGLGVTEESPTAAITDYSVTTTDDFGNVTVVRRAWAKTMSAKALFRTDALDTVTNRIASVRATPCLWIGDDGVDCLTIYGFFREFSAEVSENTSLLSLTIEGLSQAAKIAPLSVAWPNVTDPEGTKPQDSATAGSPAGTKVAGLLAEDVVANLNDVVQQAADLAATYGDTASAEQSANAAAASRSAADQALANATARASDAAGAATAASGSASVASTKADASGTSAQAAQAAVIAAQGSSGTASTAAQAAQSMAASAGASAAAASASATLAASVGPNDLNPNPSFIAYSTPGDTNTLSAPDQWAVWGALRNCYRVGGRVSPYGVLLNTATNGSTVQDGGIFLANAGGLVTPLNGWYVLELDFELVAGALPGLGVFTYSHNGNTATLECSTDADITGAVQGAGATGKSYSFRKLVQVGAGGDYTVFHVMQSWSGFGVASAQKVINLYHAGIRPATDAEIAGKRADVNANSALAQIATNQATQASVNSAQAQVNSNVSAALNSNAANISNLSTTVANNAGSAAQAIATVSAFAAAGVNLCPDVDQWTAYGGAAFARSTVWGPLVGNAQSQSGDYAFAVSPPIPCATNTTYVASADLNLVASDSGASSYIDVIVYDASGKVVLDGPNSALLSPNLDFSDTRARSTFATPAFTTPGTADHMVVRAIGHRASGTTITYQGIRRVKVERGSVPTAYTTEGALATLSGTVQTQVAVIADITTNKVKAYWQTIVNVGGTGISGVVARATNDNGTTSSDLALISGTLGYWIPRADGTLLQALAIADTGYGPELNFYGTITARTLRANAFVTDAGVDLAAIVPGSINWRTSATVAQTYTGSTIDTGLIGGTSSGNSSGGLIATFSATAAISWSSASSTRNVQIEIYYSLNGAAWASTGIIGTNNGTASGITTWPYGQKWSPPGTGTIAYAFRMTGKNNDGGGSTITVQNPGIAVENVNWK